MTQPPTLPFTWKQGEHVAVCGDTGSGKTTFCNILLYARDYTLALRSKADPAPLPGVRVRTADAFRKLDVDRNPRVVLDPVYERQFVEFYKALELVWKQGGWTTYFDELWYLQTLKAGGGFSIERQVNKLLTQGRSAKLTAICGMQRPVLVTRFAMSQATHLISFRVDPRDGKILRDVGGDEWADTVMDLKRYECAWYYRPERQVWRGYAQDLLTRA